MDLNQSFLETLTESFQIYLKTGARSNEKLKILHGKIACDLENKLQKESKEFNVYAYGIGNGKEKTLNGNYYDKTVDIAIFKNEKAIAGIAVKFVMSNFSQNANNYFEGMLGETANLRTQKLPYFQILILPETLPYFKENGDVKKIEELKKQYLHKYFKLSQDNPNLFFHTPNKTLLVIVRLPDFHNANNKEEYKKICAKQKLSYATKIKPPFEDGVIFNDYAQFLEKVFHTILAQ